MVAIAAIAAMPTDADTLTVLPRLYTFAYSVYTTDYFMSWHTRILNPGPEPLFD
jgi:hypothetical protein